MKSTTLLGINPITRLSILILICFVFCYTSLSAQQNLATKLGFVSDAKLLIIHADDLGVSHSENIASIEAMKNGMVNSGSIMMPTPWVLEIAAYAQNHKETHDLGLHLVLTSEWKHYRWRPIATKEEVPSLIDEHGYFHASCSDTLDIKEVEIELRAQIEMAYAMGIEPTHLDSHMGCLLWTNQEIFKVYVKLANEYNLPCLIDASFSSLFDSEVEFKTFLKSENQQVVVNQNLTISEADYAKGSEDYYSNVLKSLKPGLSQLLIHTGFDNEEMRGMTVDHPEWGSKWRQSDFDFFTSDKCKSILNEENIILVTWRDIKKALQK